MRPRRGRRAKQHRKRKRRRKKFPRGDFPARGENCAGRGGFHRDFPGWLLFVIRARYCTSASMLEITVASAV
ncbi:MAG: hypothetical protein MPK34_08075, partial [Gammaproteobacteria bacterium]|nr:hypothetical protein [Gammaproteobacteria bacterium]